MAVLHIQVNEPKYESKLPAHCTATIAGTKKTVIIWEAYVNHRTSQIVYLANCEGRTCMLPENCIVEGTVEHICYMKEAVCPQKQQ